MPLAAVSLAILEVMLFISFVEIFNTSSILTFLFSALTDIFPYPATNTFSSHNSSWLPRSLCPKIPRSTSPYLSIRKWDPQLHRSDTHSLLACRSSRLNLVAYKGLDDML
ncbi:hypothetical protein N431DRAFT_427365 [Stipitochalara longipes BDJ]|nr:hypothetical protein N431DRAFT_427365 [Stipitochalara longipes BDJ]